MQGNYELTLVFLAKTNEQRQTEILEEIEKYISPNGKITDKASWGKKTLAYPIKKEKEGIYWLLTLVMTRKEAKELTDKLRLNEFILRYLLIRRK